MKRRNKTMKLKASETAGPPVGFKGKLKQKYAFLIGDNSMFDEGRKEEKFEQDSIPEKVRKSFLKRLFGI
ncbi:MAG: hypothetical protein CVU05_11275 [Bacteroidetes bacterium HGW-Bacteroidetes-21]|nr:MAG: hypothetical protein CVU05_11275 [Bacteroidetes bacterium HGW-Bacteroidetes-21]